MINNPKLIEDIIKNIKNTTKEELDKAIEERGKIKMDKYKTIKSLDECDEKEIKDLLIGRKVKVEGDNLILDNGIILEIIANEGCGGCSNGWYSITKLNEVDNAIKEYKKIFDDLEEG